MCAIAHHAKCVVVLVAALAFPAAAQVQVGAGENLDDTSLNAGLFMGQPFILAPGTAFEINNAGTIGNQVGAFDVDFAGSTVNINDGGAFIVNSGGARAEGLILNLLSGASTDGRINTTDCELNILGGTAGAPGGVSHAFDLTNCVLDIQAGRVGRVTGFTNNMITVSGGTAEQLLGQDATIEISGGIVRSLVISRSTLNISGGFTERVSLGFQTPTTVTGGVVGTELHIAHTDIMTLHATDLRLDGVPIADLDAGLPPNATFTCTLADGAVQIIAEHVESHIVPDAITIAPISLGPIDTAPIDLAAGIGPPGLRPGQMLTLSGTGELPDAFGAAHATLAIHAGQVGDWLRTSFTDVTIAGGVIGDNFRALPGSNVTVNGGVIGSQFQAFHSTVDLNAGHVEQVVAGPGATVNIGAGATTGACHAGNGGTCNVAGGSHAEGGTSAGGLLNIMDGTFGQPGQGGLLRVWGGKTTISDGTIHLRLEAMSGGAIDISGGTIAGGINAWASSAINLFVQEASLDNVPMTLTPGAPTIIADRSSAPLRVTLADGSPLEFTPRAAPTVGTDEEFISPSAVLTITLVETCPCDWNTDLFLNDTDFFDWVNDYFAQSGPREESDFNEDGSENAQDFFDFVNCFFTPPAVCE